MLPVQEAWSSNSQGEVCIGWYHPRQMVGSAALNFPTAELQGWTSHLWWIQAWTSCKCTSQWFTHTSVEDFIVFAELRCVDLLWSSPLYPSCIEMSLMHSSWHRGGEPNMSWQALDWKGSAVNTYIYSKTDTALHYYGDKISSHVPQLQKIDWTKDRGLLTAPGAPEVAHSSSPTVCR